MKDLQSAFGQILFEHRNQTQMSQEFLASQCGLDRSFISMLERGKRQPTITTIFVICNVLGISPSKFVKEVEHVFKNS